MKENVNIVNILCIKVTCTADRIDVDVLFVHRYGVEVMVSDMDCTVELQIGPRYKNDPPNPYITLADVFTALERS